ncbi:MAG: GC-type dockerin domain-anchored protein [Phycisphaerales bacterium JB037]
MMRSKMTAAMMLVSVGLAQAAAEVPTEWEIRLVCRSSLDPGIVPYRLPFPSSLSSQQVSLDDDGSVAIRVVLAGSATEGIFFGDADGGGIIASVNDADPFWSSDLDLKNGRIALSFLGFNDGAEVRDTAGAVVQSFPIGGPQGIDDPGSLTMLSDGAIAARADFGSFKKNLFDEFVGGVRTQTLVADTISGTYSFLFSPMANDSRQMVGKVIRVSDGNDEVIRWEADGSATTIAEEGVGYNAFVNSTALASDGRVAFTGRRSADSIWQVTRSDGVSESVIAEGGEQGIDNGSLANFPPVINADGWVAFRATQTGGPFTSTALFVGDGENLVRIVGPGDVLETDLGSLPAGFDFGGTTGFQIMNGSVDINDAGQVAFAAFLENGTIGVFVATPVAGCAADLTGSSDPNDPSYAMPDGDADADDFFFYLDAFVAQDLGVCDFTGSSDPNDPSFGEPDGVCDGDDFFFYLDLFVAGCG